jgi:nucleoside-diphosphate-sugar epimerase
MKVSILGCGWLGLPLGVALHQGGNTVCGSTTKIDKLAVLQTHGITPFLIRLPLEDVTDVSFFQSDVLVVNIPPRRKAGLTDEYLQHLEQLRNFLLTTSLRKIVFISSTSVYPDVNREVTEADASTESYAYKAEQIFFSSPFQTTVLRFGGLFGPGRNAGIFFAGKIDIPGADSPVNLIHLDDCIAIISAIIRDGVQMNTRPGKIFIQPWPCRRALFFQRFPRYRWIGNELALKSSNKNWGTPLRFLIQWFSNK